MNTQDVFEDEWRACLRAHFFHVIRERDPGNEQSLVTVLLETGFTDEDITVMRAEALAELGWTIDLEGDSATDLSSQEEAYLEAEAVVEPPLDSAPAPGENAADSEAAELPTVSDDSDEDQPSGPPVQLSLF